jgi:hypothetical protein
MKAVFASQQISSAMTDMGHSRPSHFVPVLNNVRYASDSDHSRYEAELTLWATSRHSALRQGPALFDHLVGAGGYSTTLTHSSARTIDTVARSSVSRWILGSCAIPSPNRLPPFRDMR